MTPLGEQVSLKSSRDAAGSCFWKSYPSGRRTELMLEPLTLTLATSMTHIESFGPAGRLVSDITMQVSGCRLITAFQTQRNLRLGST